MCLARTIGPCISLRLPGCTVITILNNNNSEDGHLGPKSLLVSMVVAPSTAVEFPSSITCLASDSLFVGHALSTWCGALFPL